MEDDALVEGLAARDPAAFAALVTNYVPRMLSYATKLLRSPEAGEDAVYELLAKWVENPPTIRGPLVPFLLRSVANAVVDFERLRKRQTGQHPRMTTGTPTPPDRRYRTTLVRQEPGETDDEFERVCSQALTSLSPQDREVLEMATRTMTTEEKAAEMHKTVGAFNKHLHDARTRLIQAVARARLARVE